jgi:hypothetical protein
MTFDMNDVEPQQSGDLIPDGTFAKVRDDACAPAASTATGDDGSRSC